jgi:GTP pyrophosphokinase
LRTVYPAYKQSKITQVVNSIKLSKPRKKKNTALKIEGLITGMAVHFAGCCHPVPGDRIVGIVTTGKGVAIHSLSCKGLEKYADEPERWLDISWGEDAETDNHTARIKVMISNEPGALGELSNLIARFNANITNLNIVYRTISYFEILVDLDVKNIDHLNDIISGLKASKVISFVSRA